MKRASLLLLGVIALHCILSATGQESLPGIEQLGLGYNVVEGKDTGLPIIVVKTNGTASWINPFTGVSYSFPSYVEVQPTEGTGVEAYLFRSSFEFAQWQGWQAGLTMPPVGVFSLSTSTQSSRNIFARGTSLLAIARQRSALYRMTLAPANNLQFSSEFTTALNNLPDTYDAAAYSSFLSYYGTHFVSGAIAGGEAVAAYTVSTDYSSQNSDVVVTANTRVAFNNLKLGLGGLFSRNVSSSFASSSQVTDSYLLGGNPLYHTNISMWDKWVNSVPSAPAAVQRSLLPIASLIANPTKRASFEQAVTAYIQANNNSASSPYIEQSQLPVSGCDCYDDYSGGCPDGYLIQGYTVTGNDNCPKLPHHCCRPCFSFATAFTDALLPQTPADLARPYATKPTPARQQKQQQQMQNLPIGVLGAAYDVVKGSTVGSQVIQFTYNTGQTWVDPFNQTLQYLVPDQVNVVDDSASPYTSDTFNSGSNFSQAKASHLGISFSAGMFSFSFDMAQSISSYQNNQAITALVTQSMVFFEAAVYPNANTTSFFSTVINALPQQYDQAIYGDFLAQYGTHFVKSVVVGGQAVLDATISEYYYSTSTQSEIDTNLKSLFYTLLGYNNNDGSNYTNFQLESFAQFSVRGGNQGIVAQANANWFQAWLQTVAQAPAAISYSLAPITELVTDPVVQTNLQLAINTYLLTASEKTNQLMNSFVYPLTSTFTAPAAAIAATHDMSARRDYTNCEVNSQWASGWDEHDGSYIAWPVNCNDLYLVKQNEASLFQQLSWCSCMSVDANICPPGWFITGFNNHYDGWEGTYPQAPAECCAACISLAPESN